MTLASVVMAAGTVRAQRSFSSAKLSTSPLRAAVTYGPCRPSSSSWFRVWALASEMIPTLAHGCCPGCVLESDQDAVELLQLGAAELTRARVGPLLERRDLPVNRCRRLPHPPRQLGITQEGAHPGCAPQNGVGLLQVGGGGGERRHE